MNKDDVRALAESIVAHLQSLDAPIKESVVAMSYALIGACRTIGIDREALKDRLCRDIDIVYDSKPPTEQ